MTEQTCVTDSCGRPVHRRVVVDPYDPPHPEGCRERQTWCSDCGCCEHCYHDCGCTTCDCAYLMPTEPTLRVIMDGETT